MASVAPPATVLPGRRRTSRSESATHEALYGGVASAFACLFSNPIDVVRCRMQLGASVSGSLTGPLHAGLRPAMAYNVVLNSARFSLFHTLDEDGRVGRLASGFVAGGVAGFLSSPLARWRTLEQAGGKTLPASQRLLNARPFSGAPAWMLRNAGHTALIFYFFDAARCWLQRVQALQQTPVVHIASSLLAASASCLLMNPLDVFCTRTFYASGSSYESHGAFETAAPRQSLGAGAGAASPAPAPPTSVRATIAAGYHGLSANLLRTVPHTVVTFVAIDALRQLG